MDFTKAPASESCRLIDFDTAEVITGIVPERYILVVSGEKPYLNLEVRLIPRIYVQRPEYWEIEVVGWLTGPGLPATAPYHVSLPLDGITGTKGVEVIGASRTERLEVPPVAGDVYSQVHEAEDIPPEEQTRNVDDDFDAEREAEGMLEGAEAEMEVAALVPWRVAKSLLTLRDQVNRKAPSRNKANDGTIGDAAHASRTSDHNPWVTDGGVGVVTAMDITHDPAHGCDAGALAEAIRSSQDARVKYVIWNRRIANPLPIGGQPPWAWRPYTGANPHNHHVHVSVKSEKDSYDSVAAWPV